MRTQEHFVPSVLWRCIRRQEEHTACKHLLQNPSRWRLCKWLWYSSVSCAHKELQPVVWVCL